MKCPRCGFEQPDDIYCVECGVEVEKWLATRKIKKRRIGRLAIIAGSIFAVGLIALIVFWLIGGKSDGNEIPGATLISEEPLPPPERGDDNGEPTPVIQPPAPVDPQQPPPGSKPLPDEILQKSITEDALAGITPTDQKALENKLLKNIRVYGARDGQMTLIPFQIDTGWIAPSDGAWASGNKILVMASDLGGKDDRAYPPRGASQFWRGEVRSKSGLGWAYMYLFDYPPPLSDKSYIKFASNDDVAGKKYHVKVFGDHPLISQLSVGDIPLMLDRQKLRIVGKDETATEASAMGQFQRNVSGPIMARTKWAGTIQALKGSEPLIIETEYFPNGWKTEYTLDFAGGELPDAALRIYFDLKRGADVKVITSDHLSGLPVDGKMDDGEKNLTGQWFILAGPAGAVRVTVSGTNAGKLFYLDDAAFEDPPESEPGCLGCIGFELKVTGTTQLTLTYEILPDYKPGSPAPADTVLLPGIFTAIEAR